MSNKHADALEALSSFRPLTPRYGRIFYVYARTLDGTYDSLGPYRLAYAKEPSDQERLLPSNREFMETYNYVMSVESGHSGML